jgi:hypothetical protein
MCTEVCNLDTGKRAETVGDLAEMLSVSVEELSKFALDGYSVMGEEYCLCPLDIFCACSDAGYEAKYNEVFDIEIKKI